MSVLFAVTRLLDALCPRQDVRAELFARAMLRRILSVQMIKNIAG